MDHMKRWAAGVLINEASFLLTHAQSVLIRAMNWNKAGMNEKELAYLNKRITDLGTIRSNLSMFHNRLSRSSGKYGRLGAP